MMRILLVLIVAIVFGGAGFAGGWWYFTIFAPPQHEAEAKPPEPPPAGPPSFVNIGPLTVPVLGGDKAEQFVTLVVALEVADGTVAERVRSLAPRLTDAFVTSLYGAIGNGHMLHGGLIDVQQIKSRLLAASRKVVGDGVARDVLIQVVSQRPV